MANNPQWMNMMKKYEDANPDSELLWQMYKCKVLSWGY
jgi:hypothetical protein